jgi:hypothetical protein
MPEWFSLLSWRGRRAMSIEAVPIDEPAAVTLTRLSAENVALKFSVAALIEVLSDAQRAALAQTLISLAKASDIYNAELPAFSQGEEATHTIERTFTGLMDMAEKLRAIRARENQA